MTPRTLFERMSEAQSMTDPIGTAQERELEIQVRAVLSEHFGGAEFRQSRPRFTPAAKQIVALVQSRIAEVGRLAEVLRRIERKLSNGLANDALDDARAALSLQRRV